jgi:hypothetical protein
MVIFICSHLPITVEASFFFGEDIRFFFLLHELVFKWAGSRAGTVGWKGYANHDFRWQHDLHKKGEIDTLSVQSIFYPTRTLICVAWVGKFKHA